MSLEALRAAAAAAPPIDEPIPTELELKLVDLSKYLREINAERARLVKERDVLIRQAAHEGSGYGAICHATGLSTPQIYRVMNREKA